MHHADRVNIGKFSSPLTMLSDVTLSNLANANPARSAQMTGNPLKTRRPTLLHVERSFFRGEEIYKSTFRGLKRIEYFSFHGSNFRIHVLESE